MNSKRILAFLLTTVLLTSCGSKSIDDIDIDVENIKINVPTKPEYNKGPILSDDTYDYLDLYEVSDFHGAVNYSESSKQIGLTRLSSYINIKREENKGGTVVLSSGDMWQGSAESNLTKGYMLSYSMNHMDFVSMTIGNHEFDWTDKWIKKNKGIATFPFLCANLIDKTTQAIPEFVQSSTLVERSGYKVGIIGTIDSSVKGSILPSCVANYDFSNEVSAAQSEATKLRDAGADVIVWSSHQDVEELAQKSGSLSTLGIDVVFGGHSHVSKSIMQGDVILQQTANYGKSVAHVQLKIDKVTKAVSVNSENSVVDESPYTLPNLSEEAGVKSIYDQYNAHIEPVKQIKIGKTDADLKITTTLGNLVCKAMGEKANQFAKDNSLGYEACMALHNLTGGIRADILAGDIKYGNVYSSFPFDNELVFVKYSGTDLYKALAYQSFKGLGVWKTIKGKDQIDKTKDYYICTTDFVATSTNFNIRVKEADLVRTGCTIRDVVAKYIQSKGNIKAADYLAGSAHPEFGL